MAYNGSGVWSRLYSWVNDANNGIKIRADRMDADTNDICNNGLSAVITRDGQGSASANQPMNGFHHTGASSATASGQYLTYAQPQAVLGSQFSVGANITSAFGTSAPGFVVSTFTQTDNTTSAGTVATAYANEVGAPTFATASNAITITNAYNCYFQVPTAGAHVTMTNAWALGSDNLAVNGVSLFTGTMTGPDNGTWQAGGFFGIAGCYVGTTTNGGWTGTARAEFKATSGAAAALSAYHTGTTNALLVRIDNTSCNLTNWDYNGSSVGTVTTNGTTTAYNTSSDSRLKSNIQDAADSGPTIDALIVRQWDWKSNGAHEDWGFVAQEEVSAAPFAVLVGDSDPSTITKQWGRDDSKLVPLLVKEIQLLRARLKAAGIP